MNVSSAVKQTLPLLLGLGLALPVSAADIHALIVGINAYPKNQALIGALNDAGEMAALAREMNAASVRVLRDREANREAVIAAWREMVAQARPGDTLVFSFAGHATQLPERTPGSEDDGMDEAMVLLSADGQREQLLYDKEMRGLIEQAGAMNVVVLFDACHSGTLSRRAPEPGSAPLPVRSMSPDAFADLEGVPVSQGVALSSQPGILPNEVYFGATEDAFKVQEILFDGKPRGALTALFARGVRGGADANGDGAISRGEIRDYLTTNVSMHTSQLQKPRIAYHGTDDAPLFRTLPHTPLKAEPLRLAVRGTLPQGWSLTGTQTASQGEAELVWDASSGRITRHGDPVCQASTLEALQGEIDRWRAVAHVRALAERTAFPTVLTPDGDRSYCEKETLAFTANPRRPSHATLVNLECGGTVMPLAPGAGVRVEGDGGRHWHTQLQVNPPFGTEQLLFIATPQPPEELRKKLANLAGQRQPLAAAQAIAEAASQPGFALTVHGLYTAPRSPACPPAK